MVVIDAAAELFLAHGFPATSMDNVVAHSGVAKSNIYYHFKSKDELALAVLDSAIGRLRSAFLRDVINGAGSLADRLRAYTDWLIADLIERDCVGGCPLMSLLVEAGKANEALRARLTEFFQQQAGVFAALIAAAQRDGETRADLPAPTLAALLISWIEGGLMVASIHKNGATLRQERDALLRLVLPI